MEINSKQYYTFSDVAQDIQIPVRCTIITITSEKYWILAVLPFCIDHYRGNESSLTVRNSMHES